MKFVGLLLVALLPLSASTISSFSTSNGNAFTVTYDNFSATEANMAGRLSITAAFGVNGADGSFSCNWTNGNPPSTADCANSNFSVSFTNGADTYPSVGNGFWTITNLNSTKVLTSITFNGVIGAGNGVAFDRCISVVQGVSSFNDTNSTTGSANCDGEGTANSNIGYTAGTQSGSGTAGITAVASYTNILNLSGSGPVGDAYGVLKLVFGGTNTLTNTETFTFQADTDLVNNASATAPEPGSIALLGGGLLGLAALARRRRKQ